MAIDPSDIDPDQQRMLAEKARKTGKTESELLREALAAYFDSKDSWLRAQERSFAKVWDNEEDAVFDGM